MADDVNLELAARMQRMEAAQLRPKQGLTDAEIARLRAGRAGTVVVKTERRRVVVEKPA